MPNQDVHTKVGFGSKSSGLNESWGNMKQKICALSSKNKIERSMLGRKSFEGGHNEHWDSAFVDGGFESMDIFIVQLKDTSKLLLLVLLLMNRTFSVVFISATITS